MAAPPSGARHMLAQPLPTLVISAPRGIDHFAERRLTALAPVVRAIAQFRALSGLLAEMVQVRARMAIIHHMMPY